MLGPLEVWTDEGRPVRVPEVKVRTLLAALLAHRGRTVPVDRLVEDLWGDSGFTTRPTASLQAKVSQLRRALGDAETGGRGLVAYREPGYLLDVPAAALDAGRFRTLVAGARAAGAPRARAALYTEALALWRGLAFAGFADRPGVRPTAASLEEERLTAVEEHAQARLELGEHGPLIGELTALVERHPLREGLRGALMRALYRAGRPSDALDCFTDLRRRLDEELGLTPGPALEALQRAILRHDPEVAPPGTGTTAARLSAALPARPLPTAPVPPLIGRTQDVDRIRGLLLRRRLVTLTGPGGVGKTHLARAVAESLTVDLPDGVRLVELADAGGLARRASAESLAERVMAALGIRQSAAGDDHTTPADRLADALAARRLLLVLDNCESVVAAAAHLTGLLLSRSPGLRVLTTSQEPLRTRDETVYPVAPLSLPPADPRPRDLDELTNAGAVRLFVERATATDPEFVLDAVTGPLVADVCRRLDGIPLALELAAARVRALGIRELHDRLDDRFQLLTSGYRDAPARHRTLRAALDWSWGLLDSRDRTVLRRLSVFGEGCRLDAAEEVCAGDGVSRADVVDALGALVERSFAVRADGPHGPRYRLLESVAEYARGRLAESREGAGIAARHLDHCVRLAERARPRLHERDQSRWFQRLDLETANVHRALGEAGRTGAAGSALRLVNSLTWYWFVRGRLGEARRALAAALDTPGPAAPGERAEAVFWHAGICLLLGEHDIDKGHASLDDQPPGEPRDGTVESARAEWFLAHAQWTVGALTDGEKRIERVLARFRALRDAWGTAAALTTRAAFALARGDLETVRSDASEARDRFGDLGDLWGGLKTTDVLGRLAEIDGDYDRAARLHRESLRIAETLEMWPEVSAKLSGLGRIALLRQQYEEADDLHTRALRLAVEQGNQPAEQFAALGLALGARRRGRLDAAEERLRPWLSWNRRRADAPGLALVLAELGFIAEQRGDARRALAHHREGLAAAVTTGDPRSVALALEGLAGAHSLTGDAVRAARLLGTAAATRQHAGAPHPPAERGDVERVAARVRGAIGEDVHAREFAAGVRTDHESQAAAEGGVPGGR